MDQIHYKIKPFVHRRHNTFGFGIDFWHEQKSLALGERIWDVALQLGPFVIGVGKAEHVTGDCFK